MLVALLALSVTACGWHLRGSGPAAASLDGTAVVLDSRVGEGALVRNVREALDASGARVVEQDDQAPRLVLLEESRDQRTISVGSEGGNDEREVRYRVRWSLESADGETLAGPETLEQVRSYRFDRDEVLGSESRQDTLVDDMRREAAFLLMNRVQATLGE